MSINIKIEGIFIEWRNVQYMSVWYVDSRYGYIYRTPEPWFNISVVNANCPSAIVHKSETHVLHTYGGYLKNFGLRTALLIEVASTEEAVLLRMLADQIVNQDHGTKSRIPSLQLILENPDWKALEELCEPLKAYKRLEPKRRGDVKGTNLLQKQIDRVNMTIDDLDGVICDAYREQTTKFIEDSYAEIERIRAETRTASRKATTARRHLTRKLLSHATFTLTPNLK